MIGVLVNTATVIVGSLLGLLCHGGLPKKLTDAVMVSLGVCVVYIGISGALEGNYPPVAILSMAVGTLLGTLLDLDGKLERFGEFLNRKFRRKNSAGTAPSLAGGFVSGSLVFCVGAMTIVGSFAAGLSGDNSTLFTKAVLDLVSSCMLAATLGIGVLLAAGTVFVYQGALVLLAGVLAPVLTDAAVDELTCVGSLMIICLGLNLMNITKIKVANQLPALVLAPALSGVFGVLGI